MWPHGAAPVRAPAGRSYPGRRWKDNRGKRRHGKDTAWYRSASGLRPPMARSADRTVCEGDIRPPAGARPLRPTAYLAHWALPRPAPSNAPKRRRGHATVGRDRRPVAAGIVGPGQIASRLMDFPDNGDMHRASETICQAIYSNSSRICGAMRRGEPPVRSRGALTPRRSRTVGVGRLGSRKAPYARRRLVFVGVRVVVDASLGALLVGNRCLAGRKAPVSGRSRSRAVLPKGEGADDVARIAESDRPRWTLRFMKPSRKSSARRRVTRPTTGQTRVRRNLRQRTPHGTFAAWPGCHRIAFGTLAAGPHPPKSKILVGLFEINLRVMPSSRHRAVHGMRMSSRWKSGPEHLVSGSPPPISQNDDVALRADGHGHGPTTGGQSVRRAPWRASNGMYLVGSSLVMPSTSSICKAWMSSRWCMERGPPIGMAGQATSSSSGSSGGAWRSAVADRHHRGSSVKRWRSPGSEKRTSSDPAGLRGRRAPHARHPAAAGRTRENRRRRRRRRLPRHRRPRAGRCAPHRTGSRPEPQARRFRREPRRQALGSTLT